MPLTIFFDLDETLLTTNLDRFLPLYFDLLGQALSHLGPSKKIAAQVDFAVRKMIANKNPAKTLREVFSENFYPHLGTTEEACQPLLNTFYKDEYPKIKSVTQVKPGAANLVDWCQSKGMQIAIATNPLFPHTATYQRIQWAGLDPNSFLLFTAFDDFHFTKPHLEYYAEIFGRIGWPENPAVMIGDNITDDLHPMNAFGFETFWIKPDNQADHWEGGNLSDARQWLKQILKNNGKTQLSDLLVDLAILRATPAVLDTWLRAEPNWGPNIAKIPARSSLNEIISMFCMLEEQVYPNLWQDLQSRNINITTNQDFTGSKIFPKQNYLKGKETFERFLNARLLFLDRVNEINRTLQNEENENAIQNLTKFISWIASQDRKLLRKTVGL
jgi:FMN phosphatase YigB (HAD superfamily)